MGPRFIWQGLQVNVVQPPLQQRKDSSTFTAVVRQLDYQMRMGFAQANPACQLYGGSIFRHDKWQDDLKTKYPKIDQWKPHPLLKEADKWLFSDGKWIKGSGCVDFNGLPHWVKERNRIKLQGDDAKREKNMAHVLSLKMPIIAVIKILNDYPLHANHPYIGLDVDGNEVLRSPTDDEYVGITHAVVIVGDYIAGHNDPHKLKPGTYYLYQDSLQPQSGSGTDESMFKNLIGVLHPRVLLEGYWGKSRIPNLMLSAEQADTVRPKIVDNINIKLKEKTKLLECRKNHSKEREAGKKRQCN